MGEILGLGFSHHPGLIGPDEDMAHTLVRALTRPDVPSEWKNPENWPDAMQEEWSTDHGLAAAHRHREQFSGNLRKLREELDAFNPDLVVVWGDDQYENFKEDVVPSFCVYAFEDTDTYPLRRYPDGNFWNEETEKNFPIKVNTEAAKYLARGLLGEKIDVAYSYKPLHYEGGLSHAFHRVPLYLDYDRKGWNYPMVPLAVNCYGSRVLINRGGAYPVGKPIELAEGDLDPPGPSPDRCMEVGAAVARIMAKSPWKTALIASSSWSHAFLVPKNYFIHPDMEADRWMFERLSEGDYASLHQRTSTEIEDAGQQEVLNWYCLAGAMEELGRKVPDHIDFAETHIFNSNKCFAVYKP